MKTVLITGASRGIGLATAEKFLSEGWRVIGTSTSGKLPMEHKNLLAYQLDVADEKNIEIFVDALKKNEEKIDALINNAGVALDVWDVGVNMEKIKKTFNVNLFGLIALTEKLLLVINQSGCIINVSSRYGSFAMPIDDDTTVGYRMSKASLNMYTRFLASRMKNENICVSAINPGWVKTDMGNYSATASEKPDREPKEAAKDIFELATRENIESGQFWYKGEKFEW